jgi:hypothetical protein
MPRGLRKRSEPSAGRSRSASPSRAGPLSAASSSLGFVAALATIGKPSSAAAALLLPSVRPTGVSPDLANAGACLRGSSIAGPVDAGRAASVDRDRPDRPADQALGRARPIVTATAAEQSCDAHDADYSYRRNARQRAGFRNLQPVVREKTVGRWAGQAVIVWRYAFDVGADVAAFAADSGSLLRVTGRRESAARYKSLSCEFSAATA